MEKKKRRYISVIIILGVFLILTVALLGRYGLVLKPSSKASLTILDDQTFHDKDSVRKEKDTENEGTDCLYLWDSTDDNSVSFHDEMVKILQDMKTKYTERDLASEELPDLKEYGIVTLGFTNYQDHREVILSAVDWMEAGGNLFMPQVPETGSAYDWMKSQIGVSNLGNTYYQVSGIRIPDGFMLTGNETDYVIDFPFESALVVELDENCETYIVTADDSEVPLLWERRAGEGKAAVVNLGHYDKSFRGIYAMGYSLLKDYCAWPVINSSAYYLDGFPFPLSTGKNGYITEVYGENMNTYTFYVKEWWNDMISLAGRYDIRYTGTILENNNNNVKPPFEEESSSNRYQYFISTMLELGGEVGLYGYNQLPLCLEGSLPAESPEENLPDYEEDLGLKYWNSRQDMAQALEEASRFQKELNEEEIMQVYTPPSDIYSKEGLEVIKETLPEIQVTAASYFDGGYAQGQEFAVDEDGMILAPRITSGGYISDQMKLQALSELNMHYVFSHSLSPADVLNPDAGADLGWPAMLESLEEYEGWKDSAASDIRSQTGSEQGAAVQRFYYIDMEKEDTKEGVKFMLDNFQEEAWFMVRFNEWEPEPEKTQGGQLVCLTGNLYLLKAETEEVMVVRKDDR